ncbi:MAG: hypothetical protein KVP17_004523 [Porospora cf. gigantea B]|uniref:uncharacterized protein n=1 Tax=Porospora cf. gigantea B TaxID=2853592 RepID=UPI003571E005|nr:MAG: hypothetical protein KVP17_004523 [Porospora cf. gigantea B]
MTVSYNPLSVKFLCVLQLCAARKTDLIVDWADCILSSAKADPRPFVKVLGSVVGVLEDVQLEPHESKAVDTIKSMGIGTTQQARTSWKGTRNTFELTPVENELDVMIRDLANWNSDDIDGLLDDFDNLSGAVEHRIVDEDEYHKGPLSGTFLPPKLRDDSVSRTLSTLAVLQAWSEDELPKASDMRPFWLPNLHDDLIMGTNFNELIIKVLKLSPCVDHVEEALEREALDLNQVALHSDPSWLAVASLLSDPKSSWQWYMGGRWGSNFHNAQQYFANNIDGTTLSQVPVVVIDTECAASNPDISLSTTSCKGYDVADRDSDFGADGLARLHGTCVASLISANSDNGLGITGTCPSCLSHCIKAAFNSQYFTSASLLLAYEYILININTFPISNHSYGGTGYSIAEFKALKTLSDAGHIMVVAAGNSSCKPDDVNCASFYIPAMYDIPNMISVGASTILGTKAYFSNYGERIVDVWAPGSDIAVLSDSNDGNRVTLQNGTSFAAPLTAAAIALSIALRPYVMPADRIRMLYESTKPVDIDSSYSKHGLLDTLELLKAMVSNTDAVPTRESPSISPTVPFTAGPLTPDVPTDGPPNLSRTVQAGGAAISCFSSVILLLIASLI